MEKTPWVHRCPMAAQGFVLVPMIPRVCLPRKLPSWNDASTGAVSGEKWAEKKKREGDEVETWSSKGWIWLDYYILKGIHFDR